MAKKIFKSTKYSRVLLAWLCRFRQLVRKSETGEDGKCPWRRQLRVSNDTIEWEEPQCHKGSCTLFENLLPLDHNPRVMLKGRDLRGFWRLSKILIGCPGFRCRTLLALRAEASARSSQSNGEVSLRVSSPSFSSSSSLLPRTTASLWASIASKSSSCCKGSSHWSSGNSSGQVDWRISCQLSLKATSRIVLCLYEWR